MKAMRNCDKISTFHEAKVYILKYRIPFSKCNPVLNLINIITYKFLHASINKVSLPPM